MNILREISKEKERRRQNDPSPPLELERQFEGEEPHAHRPSDTPSLPESGSFGDGKPHLSDGPGLTTTTPTERHLPTADLNQSGSTRVEGSTQVTGSGVAGEIEI